MYVGVCRFELHIPESGSLKSKRHVVKSITGGLSAKFNVAVAEVGHQDTWQRAAIGVACVSQEAWHVRKMLEEIERFVEREDRAEVLSCESDVLNPEDE